MSNLIRKLLPSRSVKKFIPQLLWNHYALLVELADPIDPISYQAHLQNSSKAHCWVPVFIALFYAGYGIFGLPYEAGQKLWPIKQLLASPYIVTHQISPRATWSQLDFGIAFDIVTLLGIFLTLALTTRVDERFKIYQDGNKFIIGAKELNPEESEKLLKFRTKTKKLLELGVTGYYLFATLFFMSNIFLNNVYTLTPMSLLYWGYFPFFMFYIIYSIFGLIILVILASRYTYIRQLVLLEKFKALNKFVQKGKIRRESQFGQCWWRFNALNRELINLCAGILEYSRFCAPLLTVDLPFYIGVSCYMLYVVVFVGGLHILQAAMFCFAAAACNLFLFFITYECSRVVKGNNRAEVQCRLFYTRFLQRGGLKGVDSVRILRFLTHRRLHSYSFRIIGNFRITTKTYYVVLSYISVFFIYLSGDFYAKRNKSD